MGQLANHVILGSGAPVIGAGATVFHWTDRSAATVVRVSPSGKTAWIVGDVATRLDKNGMSEVQRYSYAPGTGRQIKVTLRANGEWKIEGDGKKVCFGVRDAYHDFSF